MSDRLPAEWEPQSAIMMSWPSDSLGNWKHRVKDCLLHMAIALEQNVIINCDNEQDHDYIAAQLPHDTDVQLHIAVADDIWVRDHGPVTLLRDGKPALLNFNFTGWGSRHDCELDNSLNRRLHQNGVFGKTPMQDVQLEFESGGIDCDGAGNMLLRRQWLRAHGRNADMDIDDIGELLQQLFGVDCLWLDDGHLHGDDTDDHVDMLARFAGGEVIVYASDSGNQSLQAMQKQLRNINRQHNNRWELLPIKLPQSNKHPASYINFVVGNNTLLVPQYGQHGCDHDALDRLSACFPNRIISTVDATVLAEQGGGPHCATMHIAQSMAGI
ncbi:MAG: agmatine deiminase family protein [Candidatus Porifericomitaceae bacterium WSBS_2022_MAG_OTU9]